MKSNVILLLFSYTTFFFCCFSNEPENKVNSSQNELSISPSNIGSDVLEPKSKVDIINIDGITFEATNKEKASEKEVTPEEKKRSKEFKNKCCSSLDKIQDCCCKELTEKYKNILLKDDLTSADAMKNKNPFYKKCLENKGKYFENAILEIEDSVWGEE